MAALTSNTIASTYLTLLKLTSAALGADDSAKFIEDAAGTDSALSLSTTRVGIGTAAPMSELDITATTPEINLRVDDNNRGIINYTAASTDALSLGTRSDSSNYFTTLNI